MRYQDFVIITLIGTLCSSVYLYSDQKSQNWTSVHHGTTLSHWYLVDSLIDSSFGFNVNVIWPYIISEWISYKFGIILLFYCFGIDETLRIFWFIYHKWFHYNQKAKQIYLCIWAITNDTNTYIIVPILVWIYHCYHQKHRQNNNIKYCRSHFNKIVFAYAATSIWFVVRDGYQYFYYTQKWSPLYKLPPFIITSLLFLWEKYLCTKHKNQRFIHFILLCLFIMSQELLFEWGILVYEINNLVKTLNHNLAKITVFSCYTIYFKILSAVAKLLTKHISYKQKIVFELHFIYIVFFDVYLTLYLCASPTIDWTIIYMILLKLCAKFFTFNKRIQSYLPSWLQPSHKSRTVHFVYSILASCVVYIGQITLLLIDYYIDTDDSGWILSPISAQKTVRNLTISIWLLLISLVSELFAFLLVFIASKKAHSAELIMQQSFLSHTNDDDEKKLQIKPEIDEDEAESFESMMSSEYNIYQRSWSISLPIIYFCFTVAYSQIASLNVTQFFPFLY